MYLFIKRIYLLLIGSITLRYGTIPTSADTVAAAAVTATSAAGAWTFGAWAQLAATVGTAAVQIVGVSLENFTGATSQGEVEIGSGGAGAEVALIRFNATDGNFRLPNPVIVQAGTRVAARYRTSTGAADTVDVKLVVATGF
jgi:hypothetical protein